MVQIVGKDLSVVKKVTCRHCSSILEYLPIDVRTRTSTDYTGCVDVIKYIFCPSCNNMVTV